MRPWKTKWTKWSLDGNDPALEAYTTITRVFHHVFLKRTDKSDRRRKREKLQFWSFIFIQPVAAQGHPEADNKTQVTVKNEAWFNSWIHLFFPRFCIAPDMRAFLLTHVFQNLSDKNSQVSLNKREPQKTKQTVSLHLILELAYFLLLQQMPLLFIYLGQDERSLIMCIIS